MAANARLESDLARHFARHVVRFRSQPRGVGFASIRDPHENAARSHTRLGRQRLRSILRAGGLAIALSMSAGGRIGASQLQQAPSYYPLCTSDQLAGFPWTHVAYGKSIPGIALRNMSLSTCRVAGYPELRAYLSTAKLAPIRFERAPFIDKHIYAYSVIPGAAAFFAFYGHPPSGEFDRSCMGITQLDIFLPNDREPIDVTLSTGTCGGRMSYSQMFPVGELAD